MENQYVQIFIRNSTDVPWFSDTWTQQHIDYVTETYVNTDKLIGVRELSPDGLTLTVTHTFSSPEAYQEWLNDPYMQSMLQSRHDYNILHDITEIL